jgi:DNA processing protein
MAQSDDRLFWIGLSSIPGVGRITFRKLTTHFGSPEQTLSADAESLKAVPGISRAVRDNIRSHDWRAFAEQELTRADKADVRIVTAESADYPEALRSAPDAPLLLYVRGTLSLRDLNAVAIVGTRTPTHYGTATANRFASDLAAAGFAIVSGLARGIDTCAHRGALSANGKTIAVLGCGIDVAYPPENRELIEQIAGHGAIVAENPFGTKPEAGYFPARNRIISGLSRGVIIIEASEDSGSLITAQYALEQGRKLFSVPGNVGSPGSRGTNKLIKQGATLVEDASDVLAALGAKGSAGRPRQVPDDALLSTDEKTVLRILTNEPKHIDLLQAETRITAGLLSGALVGLELKGLTKQLPGKYYILDAEM